MGNNVRTFEVEVEVERKGTTRCREINYGGGEHLRGIGRPRGPSSIWMHVTDKVVKMFHISARTPKQARNKAEKYGRPISVRKPVVEKIVGLSENLPLQQAVNPFENAIVMDEFIWKRKRRERLQSRVRDKENT